MYSLVSPRVLLRHPAQNLCHFTRMSSSMAASARTLSGLEELQRVARALQHARADKASSLAVSRAAEIASMAMGKDSHECAAAHMLRTVVAFASGDAAEGRHALKALGKCAAAHEKAVKMAQDRLVLLENAQGMVDAEMILKCEDVEMVRALVENADVERAEKRLEALEITVESLAKDKFAESAEVAPGETMEYARVMMCRAMYGPKERSVRERDGDVSRAMEALDACVGSAARWEAADECYYEQIVERCKRQVYQVRAEALLAIALGMKAKILHLEGSQAVSAEGLYRSSLVKLEQLSKQKDNSYSAACVSSLGVVAEGYSNLLDDWEKRSGEASKLRESHPKHSSNHSHLLLLGGVEPWWVC